MELAVEVVGTGVEGEVCKADEVVKGIMADVLMGYSTTKEVLPIWIWVAVEEGVGVNVVEVKMFMNNTL